MKPVHGLGNDEDLLAASFPIRKDIMSETGPGLEKLSANLKAPIIINTDNNKACQIIVEDELDIKYPIVMARPCINP